MTTKSNRGRAMLVSWIEDAAKVAQAGGGTYIGATRDGLRATAHWAAPEDAHKIHLAIDFIQRRVVCNNAAHKKGQATAEATPNPELAKTLTDLAKKLRSDFGFGASKIERLYGNPLTIGGVSWMDWGMK